MAQSGRKPVPAALRVIRGNPGKRPIPDAAQQVQPPSEKPAAPAHLCAEAVEEWDRVVPVLAGVKLLTQLDRGMLAAYCQAYGRWVQAERALADEAAKKEGGHVLTVGTVNGNAIQNPLVGIANKAAADMVRYAAEFGMSPSARMRVRAGAAGAPENPFESFRSKGA